MVTVRPARLADADEVTRIHVRTWQQAYAGIVPDDVLAAFDADLDQRIRRTRERWSGPEPGPFRTAVATTGGRPVGFVTYGPYRDGPAGDRLDPAVGEVLAIYVDPAQQGGGAGRALLDAAVAALRSGGAGEIRLWVLTGNHPARRFYERYGFAADGVTHLYQVRRPDGTPVDLPETRLVLRPGSA